MKLHFLSSHDTRLSKVFSPGPSGPELIQTYPMVKELTSHEVLVDSLQEFYEAIVAHAEQGHCLLKGLLSMPIAQQSRAGLTSPTQPTEWICLDLDFTTPLFADVPEFLEALGLPQTVSYILQYSASAGITKPAALRCHLFFMLSAPQQPGYLKYWLLERNLEALSHALEPTVTGHALRYPLDVTTCQNDKLLYIAPPTLQEPLTDPLQGNRILLVRKTQDLLTLPPLKTSPDAIEQRIRKLLKPHGKAAWRGEVLTNPNKAAVTGVRSARGFTYVNLNGGDSWGYYFPEDDVEVLYNFKGEPPVLLKALDPEFYAQQKLLHPDKYWVFREQLSDTYYTAEDQVFWPVSSKEKVQDYRRLHDLDTKDPIPVWTMEFLPTETQTIDRTRQWINTYRSTDYMTKRPKKVTTLPAVTDKIITHLTVNQPTKDHLLNWIAALVQTRDKIGTCWLLHGVQGTGKGLLFHKILAPILGVQYCHLVEQNTILEDFNAFREKALLIMIDEIKAEKSTGETFLNKIKTMVTEQHTAIRRMFRTATQTRVYDNIILTSNQPNPLALEESDRRVNVTPRVLTPLQITAEEIQELEDPRTIWQTAQFFLHYEMDIKTARTVLINAHREASILDSASGLEAICMAIRHGNLEYFVNQLKPQSEFASSTAWYQAYDRIIRAIIPNTHEPVKLQRKDLAAIFTYLLGPDIPQTPAKFTQLLGRHGIRIKPIKLEGMTTRGIIAEFKPVDPDIVPNSPPLSGNIRQLAGSHGK